MPSNVGSDNSGSSFYVSGGVQWNTKPNITRPTSTNTPTLNLDGLAHTIEWVSCADVTIDIPNNTMLISANNKSTSINLSNITSFPYTNNLMTINTVDRTPTTIIFLNQATAAVVEARMYISINSGGDPGCTLGIINGLVVSGITSSNATVSWAPVYNSQKYIIKVTTSSTPPIDYTTGVFDNGNNTTITVSPTFLLLSATTYHFWIYVIYNDLSLSNWQKITFITA